MSISVKDFVNNLLYSIDDKISQINTASIGTITRVNMMRLSCDVKLKHKPTDHEITLYEVPVALQKFNGSTIIATPKIGDIVLVLYTRNDPEEMLRSHEDSRVGEWNLFDINNAIIIGGLFTQEDIIDESLPPMVENEILIHHNTGSEIRISEPGDIIISNKKDTSYIQMDASGSIRMQSDISITMAAPLVNIDTQLLTMRAGAGINMRKISTAPKPSNRLKEVKPNEPQISH